MIISLGFAALVVVGLVQGQDAKNKCGTDGKSFFVRMSLKLCYQIIEFVVLGLVMFCGVGLVSIANTASATMYFMGSFAVLKIVFNIVSIIVGTMFTYKVWFDENCKKAMADDSFTHAPLLPILGWVFVASDCLVFVLLCCAGACSGIMVMTTN